MALILNLETATTACSVSLSKDGKLLALKELDGDYTHAENLTVFIEEVLKQSGIRINDIDAIAVSKGPGSYTGLRIGVSTAKGLCYSLGKPLIAVNTLRAMATAAAELRNIPEDSLLCPMIDARRMEVFCAIFDVSGKEIRATSADIIDEDSFSDLLSKNRMYFFGDGALKCKSVLSENNNAFFIEGINCSAKDLCRLSEEAYQSGQFEDLAYFEPFYLKDFVAGKKKGE